MEVPVLLHYAIDADFGSLKLLHTGHNLLRHVLNELLYVVLLLSHPYLKLFNIILKLFPYRHLLHQVEVVFGLAILGF